MTQYGVTELGFVKKSYADVINSLHNNAQRMFGIDVDLTPGSPIKILIDLIAGEIVGLWTQSESVYNSAFLNTATGYSLDNLGELVGAVRTSGIYASGYVTFFRTTVLPAGSPRVIPAGTKLSTTSINAKEYLTTKSVYFQPTITTEIHNVDSACYSIDAVNHIFSIQALYDNNAHDYTSSVTFSGRTITFTEQIDEDIILYLDYKPLSITAPISAIEKGADSNVAADTITIVDTPIDFIHRISNESGIDSGADVESDSHFRSKIIGATQSIGKATTNALKYYIGNVTGVKNVIIDDPFRVSTSSEIAGNGTTSFFIPHTPVYSISSIIGSINGAYTIDSFSAQTGEVEVTVATNASETIVVVYVYTVPGKIKIYVEGGEAGDEFTPDTIVYAIDTTRAAGIQSVGYDTDDASAYGSPTAKWSWFYRPNQAIIDIGMTIYFDSSSILSDAAKDLVLTEIETNITQHIDELELQDKVYKNKLIQIAIGTNSDIVDAQLTSWSDNDVIINTTNAYIQAGNQEICILRNVNLLKAIG